MPQQPLAFNSSDIPSYGITDGMPLGGEASDAMFSFEEMFDDTNMFDWVRGFTFHIPLFCFPPFFLFFNADLTLKHFLGQNVGLPRPIYPI